MLAEISDRMKAIARGRQVRVPSFYLSMIYTCVSDWAREEGMGKPFAMFALCIISAAFGAAIDHYLSGAIEQSGPHLERALSPQAAVAAPAEQNVEVLGDRVRCDFRYQQLKIPATEYQSFKHKCMGDKWGGD